MLADLKREQEQEQEGKEKAEEGKETKTITNAQKRMAYTSGILIVAGSLTAAFNTEAGIIIIGCGLLSVALPLIFDKDEEKQEGTKFPILNTNGAMPREQHTRLPRVISQKKARNQRTTEEEREQRHKSNLNSGMERLDFMAAVWNTDSSSSDEDKELEVIRPPRN